MSYTVKYSTDPQGTEYDTATQAVRGVARAVRSMPLNDAERRAFRIWYTNRNYRFVAECVRSGHRYELRVQAMGKRVVFTIDPPPPLPHQPTTPQIPVTRGGPTAP